MKKLAILYVNKLYSLKSTHSLKAIDNYSVSSGIFISGVSLIVNAVREAEVIIVLKNSKKGINYIFIYGFFWPNLILNSSNYFIKVL